MTLLINVLNQIVKDLFDQLRKEDYDFKYTMSNRQFAVNKVTKFATGENDIFLIWTEHKTPIAIMKDNIVSFEIVRGE